MLTILPAHDTNAKHAAVGIDLGTTHSLIGLYQAKQVIILPDENGEKLLPSVVRYVSEGEVIVGKRAKQDYTRDPANTFVSAKRYLPEDKILNTCVGKRTPIEASTEILKTLMVRAQRMDPNISQAVITVPAYFDETQRQATKQAAEKAGIEVLRLLNEPTAAAVAYGLDKKTSGTCLVFDLGGGTFDVSLLDLKKGIFEVRATGGDTALGGDDIDQLVMNVTGLPLMEARCLKEKLSEQERIENSPLTRGDVEALIAPLVEKMLRICRQVLQDAKITTSNIDEVILVGGSTRIPFIQQKVEAFFNQKPLCSLDPDQVVAMGAAIQASILSGHYQGEDLLLLDVTPLSLGVEMLGGLVEKIILRNTPIPAVATERFTTYAEGQTALSLHVVQGEREASEDCRSLAHFDLLGIPPMPAGKARIEVTFRIDADGLLTVEARELLSGVYAQITIKTNYGLTEADVNACVEDSISHLEVDRLKRKLLAEQQLKAAVERALAS